MQSQNATASHQQTGISYMAVTLYPALPHLAKTHPIPKKIMSQNRRHFLENLSHRGPLHVYTLESKGRTGTHNNKRLVGKITIYPLTWNRQALQDCSDTKARRISYLALVVRSLIPGKP